MSNQLKDTSPYKIDRLNNDVKLMMLEKDNIIIEKDIVIVNKDNQIMDIIQENNSYTQELLKIISNKDEIIKEKEKLIYKLQNENVFSLRNLIKKIFK